MPHALRTTGLVLLACAILTTVLTWPLAARGGRAGRIDSGDARHGIWNVAWVAHALSSDPRHLYDANIFYPHTNALAFSEPNILAGVMALPVWVTTGNALAAANWVTWWSFVLAALSAYALVHHLTRRPAAAGLAAIGFAFCPYVFSHLAHVQLLMTFGLPLTLLALHRLVEAPGWPRGALLGGALALQGLGCGYYGIFAGLATGWGIVWFAASRGLWRDRAYWTGLLVAATVAAAVLAPFLVPFAAVQDAGFVRTLDDARLFRADWRAYLASPMLVHAWMLPWLGTWREVLFPGFLMIGLAALAASRAFGAARRVLFPVRRDVVGFYLTLGGLALWASFGPDAGLYRLLFETVPFFGLLRAPSRFGILVTGAVAVMAGCALADLERRLSGVGRRVLVAVVIALALAGSIVGPLTMFDRPPVHPVYRRLAQLPAGAVAEFPFFADPFERHRHTEYMLASTWHWKPLINGYSDHMPPGAADDMAALSTFPSPAAWQVLRRREARYLVLHWNMYEAGAVPFEVVTRDAVGRYLRPVVAEDDAALYEVIAWPEGS